VPRLAEPSWRVQVSFRAALPPHGPVSAHDPVSYGAVIAVLALTALAAILVPVVRALRIDPARALRHE